MSCLLFRVFLSVYSAVNTYCVVFLFCVSSCCPFVIVHSVFSNVYLI